MKSYLSAMFVSSVVAGSSLILGATGCGPAMPSPAIDSQSVTDTTTQTSTPPTRPRIQFAETDVDLGEIVVSSDGTVATFRFVNRGNAPLKLSEVRKSCACADVDVSSALVKPQGGGIVRVLVRPQKAEERGATVTVYCDDPLQPKTELTVSWRSVAALETDPLSVDLGDVKQGETATSRVRIVRRTTTTRSLPVAGVRTQPADRLTAIYLAATDGASAEEVEIEVAAGTEWGQDSGRVFIDVGERSKSSITVPVTWNVTGAFTVVPSRVFLGVLTPGAGFQTELTVLHEPQSPAVIARIESVPGMADLKWLQASSGEAEFRVAVSGRVAAESGIANGEFVLTFSSPEAREHRVPWTAIVRQPLAEAEATADSRLESGT